MTMKYRVCILTLLTLVVSSAMAGGAKTKRPRHPFADALIKDASAFEIQITYGGRENRSKYIGLWLHAGPAKRIKTSKNIFYHPQLKKEQVVKIIDYLDQSGILNMAMINRKRSRSMKTTPHYHICINSAKTHDDADIGWGLAMYRKLEGLHGVLEGTPATDMKKLLDALAEDKKKWITNTIAIAREVIAEENAQLAASIQSQKALMTRARIKPIRRAGYEHLISQWELTIASNKIIMKQENTDLLITIAKKIIHGKLKELCKAISDTTDPSVEAAKRRQEQSGQRRLWIDKLNILKEWLIKAEGSGNKA